ncbi:Uncharacterised protein [Xylophilus ampelinus]|nr:Uncharacterised protein [Xylophilus ampelinus]
MVSEPAPETTPFRFSEVPASGARVPPAAPSVTAREVVMPAVVCSVPPSSVRTPDTSPRAASLEIDKAPPDTVHGVIAAVVPVSVQVLVLTLL